MISVRTLSKRHGARQILQQGDGAEVAKVFGGKYELLSGATAMFEQASVSEAFYDAFAIFMAHAAVAELQGAFEIADISI